MKLWHLLAIAVVFAVLFAVPWRQKTGTGFDQDAVDSGQALSSARGEVFRARWLTLDAGLVQVEVRRRVGETAPIWLARAATQLEKEFARCAPIEGWIEPWPAEDPASPGPYLALEWNEGEHVQCRVLLRKPAARSAELWSVEAWEVESAVERCFPAARRPES